MIINKKEGVIIIKLKLKQFYKSKKWIILCTLLIAGSISIGSAFAFMTISTNTKSNVFAVGRSGITAALEQPNWNKLSIQDKTVYPEQQLSKDPKIKNTGSVPFYAYITVKIPRSNVQTISQKTTVNPKTNQDLFSFSQNPKWTQIEAIKDTSYSTYVFAYNDILNPGQETVPVFNSIRFLNLSTGSLPSGTKFSIPISGDAIQSDYLKENMKQTYEHYIQQK